MAIYALTDSGYRQRMSEQKFTAGLNVFSVKAGRWQETSFEADSAGGIYYNASFEHSKQIFYIALDSNGKITRFNFTAVKLSAQTKTLKVKSNNPLATPVDQLVERYVRPYMQKENTTGLCIAVIKAGKVDRYSYGETSKMSGQLPDCEHTIFEIGSLTKTFTSLLLADEVIHKRISLDASINCYLPDSIPSLAYQGKPISLKNLANHTSGLPRLPDNIFQGKVDPADPYRHYNVSLLHRFLMHYQPAVQPGTVFSYSNLGAGLLGELLARHAHATFEHLVVSRICVPLHMNNTGIVLQERKDRQFAQGYNETGEATAPWHLVSLQGSGTISSTLNDMIKYTQAQMGVNSPLAEAIRLTHAMTFGSKENTIGLGWRISQYNDYTYWHHSGGTGGFRSFVGFDKKRQIGIIILSNAAEDVTGIGEDILQS